MLWLSHGLFLFQGFIEIIAEFKRKNAKIVFACLSVSILNRAALERNLNLPDGNILKPELFSI